MIRLADVKQANYNWFKPENKRFFGDLNYFILHNNEGNPFLIRETNAWSDMFDGIKKPHFRINTINPETLKIGELHDRIFKTREEVKEYLKD